MSRTRGIYYYYALSVRLSFVTRKPIKIKRELKIQTHLESGSVSTVLMATSVFRGKERTFPWQWQLTQNSPAGSSHLWKGPSGSQQKIQSKRHRYF